MNENFCSGVNAGLFVSVNGGIKVCCAGGYDLGNIRETSVQDIFKNKKFIQLYQAVNFNSPTKYCFNCNNLERQAPGTTQKSAFNTQYPNLKSREIKLLDIRWSNVCNLSCRYCNIDDSSEWRKLHNLPIETVNRDYTESLFELIEQNVDSIDSLYLLGGEPLLQKHNERLLGLLNKNVKIDILTNGSVKLDNNRIYQLLKEFPRVYWNLSFDTVGDRFEYVRHGADWELLNNNIDKLINDFGSNHVTFHPVYSIWNALNLEEFYDFARTKGNRLVNWQMALPKVDTDLGTDSFLVPGHNPAVIEAAVNEINKLDIPVLNSIKQTLLDTSAVGNRSKNFLAWTAKMEQFMPPKNQFIELWPRLNTLLNS